MAPKRVYNPITVNYDDWDTSKVKLVEDEENDKPILKYDDHSPVFLSFIRKNGKQAFWTMYGIKKGKKYEIKKGKGRYIDEWDGKWSISMQLRDNAHYTADDRDDGAIICHILDDIQNKLEEYYTNQGVEHKIISPYSYTKVDPDDLGEKKKKDSDKSKKKKEKVIDMSKPIYLSMECPFSIKSGKRKDKDGNIPFNARKLSLRTFKKTKNGLVETSPEDICLEDGEFKRYNCIPNTNVYLTEGPSKDKIRVKLRVNEIIYSAIKFKVESQFEGMDISKINDMPDEDDEQEQVKPCSKKQDFNFADMPDDDSDQSMSDDEDVMIRDEKPKKKKNTVHDDIELSDDE